MNQTMNQTEDRTLNPVKRGNKQRRARNGNAWKIFSPDGTTCRFCQHDNTAHLISSGVPHFYRPATQRELSDSSQKLYRHDLPDGNSMTVKPVNITSRAELITAFCTLCASDKQTSQVLCYQRTLARGEVVGLKIENANNGE